MPEGYPTREHHPRCIEASTMDKNRDSKFWRDSYYHRLLGLKAADEVKRLLPLFEKECPNDTRPREAIETIRAWARGKRTLGLAEVRKLSLASHAAARDHYPHFSRPSERLWVDGGNL